MNLTPEQKRRIVDGVTPGGGLPAIPPEQDDRFLEKARMWDQAKRIGREEGRAEGRAEILAENETRIAWLEAQVAALLEHAGLDPTRAHPALTRKHTRRCDSPIADTDRLEG